MREVRNLDNELRRGYPVGRRGSIVKHMGIGCGRLPCDVRPAPLGISLCNLGDHICLAHLRANGNALLTKCPT